MKKIKDMWQNNKIIFILIIILIVCFVAIISVSLSYFVGSEKSPYGTRLDGVAKVTDEQKNKIIDTLKGDSSVSDVTVRKSIRTIYITIVFNADVTLESAEEKATSTIDLISEDVLKDYDINFILSNNSTDDSTKFNIMGCRNSNGNGVYWNNNTQEEEEEVE